MARHCPAEKARLCEEEWVEWCRGLGPHSTLRQLWLRLRSVSSPPAPRLPSHPDAPGEAERLAAHFATRAGLDLLPEATRARVEELSATRQAAITAAVEEADPADVEFTPHELEVALHRSRDTAPGADGIVYSMLRHLGPTGRATLLTLYNTSWAAGTLPPQWREALIQPIPKPGAPGSFRPISLLSVLSKNMERMVLSRLSWRVGPLSECLFAFRPNTSATDCLASFLGTLRNKKGLAVFVDLEKAFEMANPDAILAALAGKGIGGRLLSWLSSFLRLRSGRVKFQGCLSRPRPPTGHAPG